MGDSSRLRVTYAERLGSRCGIWSLRRVKGTMPMLPAVTSEREGKACRAQYKTAVRLQEIARLYPTPDGPQHVIPREQFARSEPVGGQVDQKRWDGDQKRKSRARSSTRGGMEPPANRQVRGRATTVTRLQGRSRHRGAGTMAEARAAASELEGERTDIPAAFSCG